MVGLLFKLFIRLCCHPPIKLGILREAVDERHKGVADLHQAVSRLSVGDVVHLLLGDIEQRGQLLPVAGRLVVHDDKLRVGEHTARRHVIKQIVG